MSESSLTELLRRENKSFEATLPSVRMDRDLLDAIDRIAKDQGVKRSVVVRAALRFFLESNVSLTNNGEAKHE